MFQNLENNGVSVVVCTYNGAPRLLKTFGHLLGQINCDFPWEVVLIDNGSSDSTTTTARKLWNEDNPPCDLRIFVEEKRGTMHARKRGIQEAKYRYLLYCDDDNWLKNDFVSRAYKLISADTSIAAIGAKGKMVFDEGFEPPSWVNHFAGSYGTGPQGKSDGDTTFDKGCLYTAGAIIDRQWLDKLFSLGFRSALTGRDDKSLVAGEDTELTYALKLVGGKLHYSSLLEFYHYMPPGRIDWAYLRRLWKSFGYSDFLLSPYKAVLKDRPTASRLRTVAARLKGVLFAYLKALSRGFNEGDSAVLNFDRKRGGLDAVFAESIRVKEIQEIVAKFVANSKKFK